MENKNLPNNAKQQCKQQCHNKQQHNRQPQQCRNQQCRSHQHRPQIVNISVNIGTIIMPVNVTKGGKKEGEQPSQFDKLVNEVLAAVSKKLQQ